MIICKNCGHLNPEGSKFCENCGALIEETRAHQSVVSQGERQVEQETQSSKLSPKKPNNKSLIIGIIIIVLLVLAAGFDYMKNHNGDETRTENTKNSTDKNNKHDEPKSNQSSSDADVKTILSSNLSGIKGDTTAYYYNLDDDTTASYGDAKTPQRAASDIKLYIMAAAFQKIADGDISLNDRYELTNDDKVGGTGVTQNMQAGESLTYRDLIDYMITKSDNTAANIITKEVGGMSAVNDEIEKLGLSDNTKMERMLMDQDALAEGKDNKTTSYDLAIFMKKLYRHDVVSAKYDKEMMSVLSNTSNHSKIPAEINTNVVDVYNKTGEYADYGVENDAAILKRDNKAFVLVVMSQNGDSDEQKDAMGSLGKELTQEILGN